MSTQAIDELYNNEIRTRPREERERLIELARRDLESDKPQQIDRTHELFEQWRQEDEAMTPDEIEAERLSWEELKANLNAERDRAGARRLF